MAFKDIIGQEKALRILQKTIERGKIPSSYLFAGESGIGKKYTAINLAKTVNCLKAADSEHIPVDSCDACSSCNKIDAGVHPDYLLVSPEGGQIRIEEIRPVDNRLSLKPFEGRKKIVIIDDADAMNVFASNAFLKTLEEPPKDSLIILVSSKPDNLPDTIRSRCSRINFTPLSYEASQSVIQRAIGQEEKTPREISALLRLSFGRPGLVLSGELLEEREWFLKLFKGMLLLRKDGWASRDEMEKWHNLLLVFLRDMAILKITRKETDLINNDQGEFINSFSKSMDIKVIIEIYQKINLLRRYFYFNLNRSLTWNYTSSLLRTAMDGAYA
jgi:DNA polymerase-3 subunit delta'